MSSVQILSIIIAYFVLIFIISYFTGRKADNKTFFLGNRKSPWYVVAFGMIGASLSGVTFISVPGWVGTTGFSYLQMVLGYMLGYIVIAQILLPLYYKLNLTSIYSYLEQRFGRHSYKTGAAFFLLSRTIGASFRLFLVANVLQITVFDTWNIPFYITVILTILLIWLYTFKGGIRTIVWTDTLQTAFMLLAVGFTIYYISDHMQLNLKQIISTVAESDYSKIFFFDDWTDKKFFIKQFLSGAFITIVMTGLDQDMMQKNLTCRNLKDAKKNMYWYGFAFLPVNLLFMALGALLFIFANQNGIAIPERSDDLFPLIATSQLLPSIVSAFFILGLIAAAYSSADSALTSLTTSFSLDILDMEKRYKETKDRIRIRKFVHIGFSLLLLGVIMLFRAINDESVISALFTVAGYTYGPLLGMYAFGMFTKRKVQDRLVPYIAILSPFACWLLNYLTGNAFGFELLIINGTITFTGMWFLSISETSN